jgi:hypothetical protein
MVQGKKRGRSPISVVAAKTDSVPVSFRLLLANNRKWYLDIGNHNGMTFVPMTKGGFGNRAELANFDSAVADIILRPDPAAAERMADIEEIWGEDIVIPNVPITRTK